MDSLIKDLTQNLSMSAHGQFSVDLRAAGRKQTALAKQEPSRMLGCLVQLAVALNGKEIRFTVNGEGRVVGKVPVERLQDSPAAREYLEQAMVLASAQNPRILDWTPGEKLAVFTFLPASQGFWKDLIGGIFPRASHHRWLTESFRFCPIPIFLDACRMNEPSIQSKSMVVIELADGRQELRHRMVIPSLQSFASGRVHLGGQVYESWGFKATSCHLLGPSAPRVEIDPDYTDQRYSSQVVPLGWRIDAQRGRGRWEWTDAQDYFSTSTTPRGTMTQMRANSIYLCGSGSSPGRLFAIRDGYSLRPVEIKELPRNSELYVPAPDLNLDLEGHSVVVDERCHQLVQNYLEKLKGLN